EVNIPKNWNWKIENYEKVEIIDFGIVAFSDVDEMGKINVITVEKMKGISGSQETKVEYQKFLEVQQKSGKFELIDSGETNLLGPKTFYIQSQTSSKKNEGIEMITLITKNNVYDGFFVITLSASKKKD
ncbi:hypothetical protein RZS08_38275, partial [Arthrospira platensis SPKY1]|nr:hypothetical protein [Arthrospira platensis SPKY1]